MLTGNPMGIGRSSAHFYSLTFPAFSCYVQARYLTGFNGLEAAVVICAVALNPFGWAHPVPAHKTAH